MLDFKSYIRALFRKKNCRNKDRLKLEVQIQNLASRQVSGAKILAPSVTKIETSCKFGKVSFWI